MVQPTRGTNNLLCSTAHGVLNTDLLNPSRPVLKMICFPDTKELRVPAVMWGKEQEMDALKDYRKQ